MPHGKRWKVTFFLLNEATGESFSMVFENDFDHEVATLVAERAISMCNLLRISPSVDDVVVNMMCHTCGFESQDSFVSSCNCDDFAQNEENL
jgi:hypothetical protein